MLLVEGLAATIALVAWNRGICVVDGVIIFVDGVTAKAKERRRRPIIVIVVGAALANAIKDWTIMTSSSANLGFMPVPVVSRVRQAKSNSQTKTTFEMRCLAFFNIFQG